MFHLENVKPYKFEEFIFCFKKIFMKSNLSTYFFKTKPAALLQVFHLSVTPAGFKPATAGAEIQCAIQLRHRALLISIQEEW